VKRQVKQSRDGQLERVSDGVGQVRTMGGFSRATKAEKSILADIPGYGLQAPFVSSFLNGL